MNNAVLAGLRLQISALIAVLAAVIIVVFAVVAIRLDRDLREEQFDAALLAETNRAAGLVSFDDNEPDLSLLNAVDDSLIIGLRPEFDIVAFVDDADAWDEIPEPSLEELDQFSRDVIDELDDDTIEFYFEDDEDDLPIDEMREILIDDPTEDIVDEAWRNFLLDAANEADIELEVETEVTIGATLEGVIDDVVAGDAVGEVADDGVDDLFPIDDNVLVGRGVVLRSGAEVRGAVIAVADRSIVDEDHASFRRSIIGLGLIVTMLSTIAAWFVAGRTIRPAARALEQQERFLADAAHELRTPITAIRATAETAGEPREQLERVAILAAGAATLTDDLLTLARMDAERMTLETEPLRLDLLVEMIVDGDEAFVLELTESVVDGDPRLLERAIHNLLDNAKHHGSASSNKPGRVTVRAGELTVYDRGPGIRPEVAERIFERFQSGGESKGHGLGLPLARWIAHAHGGDLRVVDPAGGGAALRLSLP